MTKNNFIIVITLISVLSLLFSQSVYDPSVYAKMQKVEDENLSDVTGESLYLEINATVSAFASDLSINNAEGDELHFGPTAIGANYGVGNTRIFSSQLADVGSVPGQTWILLGNLEFPASNGIGGNSLGLNISNLSFVGHYWNVSTRTRSSTLYTIGNVTIEGFHYGHNVYGMSPWFDQGDAPFIMYSANDTNGLEIRSEFGGYINQVKLNWNSAMSSLTASGVYIYYGFGSLANNIPYGNPAQWSSSLTGKMKLGGQFPTYTTSGSVLNVTGWKSMAAINIGSSGGRSIIFMDMPMHGSIRVRNLSFAGLNLGPVAIDDVVFYRNMLEWDLGRFAE